MNAEQAMSRWQTGHRSFFVLIQGIILAQRRLEKALIQGDIKRAKTLFRQATRLLDGSAAAMLFAGDMPPECYVVIRKSMTPPNVLPKFSGLWSVDHKAMMDGLKALKPLLYKISSDLEVERQAWQDALDRTYSAHAFVCEKFVGNGPSIVMATENELHRSKNKNSAIDNIELFRKRALLLVSSENAKT